MGTRSPATCTVRDSITDFINLGEDILNPILVPPAHMASDARVRYR